jgi:hypothetical protein
VNTGSLTGGLRVPELQFRLHGAARTAFRSDRREATRKLSDEWTKFALETATGRLNL